MFSRILVANRGEIAVRIFRTCRELGIATVAVYSPADRDALHVQQADQALALAGSAPEDGYLDVEQIVVAARDSGAQAIHPGYGFLAESARLAGACRQAGLVFIGPPARVLELAGDKLAARRLAREAGVPPTAGTDQPLADLAALRRQASRLGYPLLVKAAAGGVGKGMRRVDEERQLEQALQMAAGEARAAFGDERLFLERYRQRVHHVEVQILADDSGRLVHLFERECSIQRRHQKIIEEAPAPLLDDDLRQQLCSDALAVARAAGYRNAGTVEFLVDEEGNYSFMEINARLQVEHPVTELLTGIDLVEQQIRLAAGEPLSLAQEDIGRRGHALECRIYAEDPTRDFLPSPGTISVCEAPAGPGIRFDSGVGAGSVVPVDYDPILAKLIVHAGDRPRAAARLARALDETCILGVSTPLELLGDIVRSPQFLDGDTTTDFLERHFADWRPSPRRLQVALLGWLAERLAGGETPPPPGGDAGSGGAGDDPWRRLRRFRMGGRS